jgi:type VI protein secretion system component VasF
MEPDERRGRRRIPGWVIAALAVILGLALMIFLHVSGIMGRSLHG